jgi:endonuclease YncB( thermonuclease family)
MATAIDLKKRLRPGPGEVRLAALAGAVAGLVYAAIPAAPPESVAIPPAAADVPDPWAESRRSAAILQAQEATPEPELGTTRTTVANGTWRIIDGDTFAVGEDKIRIADIDTPEVNGRCPQETALAARATARMEALLAEGPFELQRAGRDQDRYGRKLRVVTRGGRSLGDVLVAEGLARTWTGRREPWCEGQG